MAGSKVKSGLKTDQMIDKADYQVNNKIDGGVDTNHKPENCMYKILS